MQISKYYTMKYYIPTYSDARKIVDVNPDTMDFYFTTHNVNGYRVDIFNYKFAWYDEFYDIPKQVGLEHAKEMRGLTFVFNENIKPNQDYTISELSDNMFTRFIALEKFWNINQVAETQLVDLLDTPIKSISTKLDGSLALFIMLPNGDIIGKTKAGFQNTQTDGINHIFKTDMFIQHLVSYCLHNNIIPIFEYTSPSNRIVLDYGEPKLTLTQIRNNLTGEFIDFNTIPEKYLINVPTSKPKSLNVVIHDLIDKFELTVEKPYTLQTLHDIAGNAAVKNIEGWVIRGEGMFKQKTEWYFNNHKLFSEHIHKEQHLIKWILTNKIDDIVAQMDVNINEMVLTEINNITIKLLTYINSETTIIRPLVDNYKNFGNTKEYVAFYIDNKRFKQLITIINTLNKASNKNALEVINGVIVKNILTQTTKQEKARTFLNKIY